VEFTILIQNGKRDGCKTDSFFVAFAHDLDPQYGCDKSPCHPYKYNNGQQE